jgi:hypothetical protein
MNGPALIFPVVPTRKLSCAFLRLATTASATPTLTTAATIHHESVSTSKSEERPPTLKEVQDLLSEGTPLHLPTRLPGSILEHAGPLQPPQKGGAPTLNSSMS